MYKCLYNLELLVLGTGHPPFQSYDEPIKAETPANYVRQLRNTDIDAVMICPTAWKRALWPSKIDPHWTTESPLIKQKYFSADYLYQEKAYFRLRDYMMQGNDPVKETVRAACENGIEPFISYRMNDHHYMHQEDSYIHPKFWKENKQYWLCNSGYSSVAADNRHFNYMFEEVRDYYFGLLDELVSLYDVAGLELDFMRSPQYFADEDLETGKEIMTEFVKKIRRMLDKYGEIRKKKLNLCVRVPHTLKWCSNVGLDVERWDTENLIDMVNVSSYFFTTPYIEVENFKSIIKNAKCYGEIHFIVEEAQIYNGFCNNVTRKTTKEMYRALAANYLDRGIDGISLFNVEYTRDHHFNEPRRLKLKDGEPPYHAFYGIADLEYLERFDKHYIVGPKFSCLPMINNLNMQLYVADDMKKGIFKYAILRIKTKEPCQSISMEAKINGVELEEINWTGELFLPVSKEGAARAEYVKCYNVPSEIIRKGNNNIVVKNTCYDPTLWDKQAVYNVVELALYKENSLLKGEEADRCI